MIIALHGQDTFHSRRELKRLREAFISKYDPSGLNTATLRDDGLTFDAIQSAATAQGLLSPRRFVAIERATEASKELQQHIAALLERGRIPAEHVVVFWDESPAEDRRARKVAPATPLGSWLSKLPSRSRSVRPGQSYRQDFPLLSGRLLEHAVQALADERRVRMTPNAITELVAYTQGDLWQINNIIPVLGHAAGKSEASENLVREYVHAEADADIFKLMDAVSERRESQALALLEESFAAGEHPLGLLAMLQRQFRILTLVQEASKTETRPDAIARELSLHPFVVQKALRQVRGFTVRELGDANSRLLVIEEQAKTTPVDPRLLITTFVAEIALGQP